MSKITHYQETFYGDWAVLLLDGKVFAEGHQIYTHDWKKLLEHMEGSLVEGEDLFAKIDKSLETYVILFFGINGTGKTTSVAKLAWALKKRGVSCLLVAADTFRAASIEQLEKHASKVGAKIFKGEYGKDPASVVFDALSFAKKEKIT